MEPRTTVLRRDLAARVMMARGGVRRGLVAVVGAVVLVGGSLVSAATGAAAAVKVTGNGRVRCAVAGKAKYKPALLPTAQPGRVLSLAATLACGVGQTGNGSAVVTGGKLQATSGPFTGSCTAPNPSSLTATIRWKATGAKVNPTSFVTGAPRSSSTSPYRYGFTTTAVTGSYAGESAALDGSEMGRSPTRPCPCK